MDFILNKFWSRNILTDFGNVLHCSNLKLLNLCIVFYTTKLKFHFTIVFVKLLIVLIKLCGSWLTAAINTFFVSAQN